MIIHSHKLNHLNTRPRITQPPFTPSVGHLIQRANRTKIETQSSADRITSSISPAHQKEKKRRERELAYLMQQIREKEHLIENLQSSLDESPVPVRYEAFDLLYRLKSEPHYGIIKEEDEWIQLYAVINRLYGDIMIHLENCHPQK